MESRGCPWTPGQALPGVTRTIGRAQVQRYAEASGDRNPLHLDDEFAAATRFGGIIAHGMMTLALVSEMMTGAFGRRWLESGALKVRFKGAAYLEDVVEAWGEVSREQVEEPERLVTCSVGVRKLPQGEDLITGTASVRLSI